MKKRYQKAPRISKWNRAEYFCINRIKEMEKITGEPIPPDLKEIMMNVAKLESLKPAVNRSVANDVVRLEARELSVKSSR